MIAVSLTVFTLLCLIAGFMTGVCFCAAVYLTSYTWMARK